MLKATRNRTTRRPLLIHMEENTHHSRRKISTSIITPIQCEPIAGRFGCLLARQTRHQSKDTESQRGKRIMSELGSGVTLFACPGHDCEKLALSWQPRCTFMPHASQEKPWVNTCQPSIRAKERTSCGEAVMLTYIDRLWVSLEIRIAFVMQC